MSSVSSTADNLISKRGGRGIDGRSLRALADRRGRPRGPVLGFVPPTSILIREAATGLFLPAVDRRLLRTRGVGGLRSECLVSHRRVALSLPAISRKTASLSSW
jgi:hypothetical protein